MTMNFADKIGRALDARTSKSESDYCAGELLNCYIRKQFNSIDCMEAVAVVTNSAAVHGADGSMQVEMYPPADSKGAYEDWSDMIFRELRPAYDAFGWRLPIDNVA